MNNNLKFGAFAMAALALTACSSEELIDNNVVTNASEISFSVASELTTRGQQSYCNTNLPQDFQVLAKYSDNNGIYFDAQTATKNGSAWTLGKTTYWPEKNLDFVAWKNASTDYDYNNGQPIFSNFAPAATAQEQLDFIYAVTLGKNDGQVKLNFRHALSQVVFRADNASDLKVEIKGVKVGKIHSEGNFTLLALATDKNYENHEYDANGEEANIDNQGIWDGVQDSELKDYSVEFPSVEIGNDIVWLTDVNHIDGGDLSMLLLPQEATAWDPTVKAEDFNGAYFALDVILTNEDDKEVYQGWACVPVDIKWEQGIRYIYTFHFISGGNAGYTPDPDDPQPVLATITFDLSTDDFKPADNNIIDMNAGETTEPEPDPEPVAPEYHLNLSIVKGEGNVENDDFTYEELPAVVYLGKYSVTAPEGYDFLGWSTTEGATEAEYAADGTITLNDLEDGENYLTVYAVYKKYYIYTLNFLAADMTDESVDQSTLPAAITQESYEESIEFTIPESTPLCGNYKFQGWAETDDWDASTPRVNAGDKVTLTKDQVTMNLYTVWSVSDHFGLGDSTGEEW